MNNYLIVDAISYLDIDILASYLKEKGRLMNKVKSKKYSSILKRSVIAACVCFALVISVMLFPAIQNYVTEGETIKYYPIGKTVENKYGALTLTESDTENKICTFTLVKKNNTPVYFKFGGVIVEDEYTDEQGEIHQKIQVVDVVTSYDGYKPDKGHKVVDIDLLIIVNGEDAESIPTAPGEYEIKIDYSALYDYLTTVDDMVEVFKFGNFGLIDYNKI